ncbi:GNAT family N-acetyltransferase [Tenggerimyces flavus]|nr:GNAT family N-acetyltransferase [Tenggerimyces flavus]MBM7790058.1 RimJ/RimL family protein N-acetyltransferase/predicted GNAT family acetyltransferase [Tenggerimyces flavus]
MSRLPDTERLTFRRFTNADLDNVEQLNGDAEVMRFLDGGPQPRAEIEERALPELIADQNENGLGRWAAETVDGTFVGWFSTHARTPDDGPMEFWASSDDPTVVSIGYRLSRAAWGKGYATEGAKALLRWAFLTLGATEVVASTMAVNKGSRNVMEKIGLRHDRTIHLDWPDPLPGTEHGEVEYRLHRDEWITLRPARPDEAGELTELVMRSKAYWGYDDAFMAACREELTVRPEDIEQRRMFVATAGDELAAVATLDGAPPDGELGTLFVDPAFIGQGLGKRLYRHVTALARAMGFASLSIDADPNAEPFYKAMGATRVGSAPSGSIPGREVPLMRVDLAS